jgi:hypothetical protein
MTALDDIAKLNDYEAEDIGDILGTLEKSFALKFDKNAFENVKTFGDMCEVIESHIDYDDVDDCTTQQAFYKIRLAISETKLVDRNFVALDTKLADIFPRQNRRTQVKLFQKHLGFKLKFLTYPDWLLLTFLFGLLMSFVTFFFDWKIALSGIAFFALALKIADLLGKDLEYDTLKDLTEKAAKEHYMALRRSKLTVNRKEIMPIIVNAFSDGLSIDKENLTPDAKFSWA